MRERFDREGPLLHTKMMSTNYSGCWNGAEPPSLQVSYLLYITKIDIGAFRLKIDLAPRGVRAAALVHQFAIDDIR